MVRVTIGAATRTMSVVWMLSIALVATADGQAQQATQRARDPDPPPRHVSMTVSGGVSLGSYQAGATWAFVYVLRNYAALDAARASFLARPGQARALGTPATGLLAPRRYILDVLTGASAGNVNAVLAATEYCAASPPRQPEESLFWKAWIPIGFTQLVEGEVKAPNLSAFSRAAFETVWDTLNRRLQSAAQVPGCDLLLGITATKLTPHTLDVALGLAVPVQRFAGVFRLVAHPAGLSFALPRSSDVLHTDLTDILILDPAMHPGTRVPLPPLPRGGIALDVSRIRDLVEASGSFPVAFAPREVSYRLLDELKWGGGEQTPPPCLWNDTATSPLGRVCTDSRTDRFVDGGVFDNRPLNLALGLARAVEEVEWQAWDEHGQRLLASATEALKRACVKTDEGIPFAALLTDSVSALVGRLALIDTVLRADSIARAGRAADTLATDSLTHLRGVRTAATSQLHQAIDDLRAVSREMEQSSKARDACANASTRIATLQDSLDAEKNRELPARLIYFIDDDARRARAPEPGEVRQASRTSGPVQPNPRREPRAGVAAAALVVSKAFQTGLNSELRAFARRINGEQLGVNSRYPRLMAEHIGHFGAFLSVTFREHDFYAGVYDGLRSAFRELYCRDESRMRVGDSRAPAGRTACEVAWLRLVLDHGALNLRPEGREVIERIFAHEERKAVPLTPSDTGQKVRALVSLVDANFAAREPNVRKCTTAGILIEDPLCSDQLLTVIEKWRGLLKRDYPGGVRALCNGPRRDLDACRMVRDPRAIYHEVTMQVLARVWQAEAALDREDGKGHPGPVGIPLFVERAFNDQFRTCWHPTRLHCADLNPTTSDVLGGTWYAGVGRALPVTIAGLRNGTAHWFEWRPTLFMGRKAGFSVAAIAPIQAIRRGGHVRAGMGGGLMITPSTPWISSISVSRIGEQESIPTTDVTLAVLAGTLRIGVRDESKSFVPFLFSGSHVTLGVGDANGLTTRFLAWGARGGMKFVGRQISRLF